MDLIEGNDTSLAALPMLCACLFRRGWVAAVNKHGGFGQWSWDVSMDPGDIKDILARQPRSLCPINAHNQTTGQPGDLASMPLPLP